MDANVERASRLDTSTISDALDRLGIATQCLGIKPRDPKFRMTGRAHTLLYRPCDVVAGSVGDYIDDIEPGSVLCLDNQGREDATVWGDILTFIAHKRGIAGTVIDGACRDTALCMELGYPIYSRSFSMRTGKDRVQMDGEQVPINIGGARIHPGDILRGDADGVVCIPKSREDEVLAAAEEIDKAEAAIREYVAGGKRLDDARKEFRYHQLQTRSKE